MEKILDPYKEDKSSYQYAKETAELLAQILQEKLEKDFRGVDDLLKIINTFRKTLTSARPLDFSIGNIIKRVVSIIKEQSKRLDLPISEDIAEQSDDKAEEKVIRRLGSFNPLYKHDSLVQSQVPEKQEIDTYKVMEFKSSLQSAMDEISEEFRDLSDSINMGASFHINSNEIIITFGSSYTLTELFIDSRKKKNFEVIIVESNFSPQKSHKMAEKLEEAKIKTTVIPDTAIYAIMTRVHKAFISAHAIMANGGILGTSGTLLMAMACKAHLVPLIVVGGIYKLTPRIPFDQDTYNELLNPGETLEIKDEIKSENIDVVIPGYDYVEPDYVTLFITNMGENTPAYLYRIFSEYYVKE